MHAGMELPLMEATGIPEIYADGIGGVEIIYPTFWTTYFRIQKVADTYVRVPVLRIGRCLIDHRPSLMELIAKEKKRITLPLTH